jgi:hypothetical protein
MTSYQVAEWLRKGIAAAQAGDTETAYGLLLKVVDVDEYNEQAWLWLSSVVETDADREVCLENVLAINPDNKVAKAGLVHLRSKSTQPPPPLEPEVEPPQPEVELAPIAAPEDTEVEESDWWDQPQAAETVSELDDAWEERLARATAPATIAPEPEAEGEDVPAVAATVPRRRARATQPAARPFATAVLLILGILAATVALLAVLQVGVFNPRKRNYAHAMRPVLAAYDAWWVGAQGPLVSQLSSLCGPGANGWRNRDVLITCNSNPSVECARLAAHCGADVEAMREQIEELSQKARQTGEALIAEFDTVSPPDEIASSHQRFVACLEERVTDAGQVSKLARGELMSAQDDVPICRMFSSAEAELRSYIGPASQPTDAVEED